MAANPVSGAIYFVRGFRFITRKGVRHLVVLPLLVNILLFALMIHFGRGYYAESMDALRGLLPDWQWLSWFSWLLWPFFVILALLFVGLFFSVFANICNGFFYGALAAEVERNVTGHAPPSLPQGIVGGVVRGAMEVLRRLLYLLWIVPLLLLLWIPGVNLIIPLFGAWVLALDYSDFPLANHGLDFKRQRELLAKKRWLCIGFGGIVLFALSIPIFNLIAMPAAAIGATLMWIHEFKPLLNPPSRC